MAAATLGAIAYGMAAVMSEGGIKVGLWAYASWKKDLEKRDKRSQVRAFAVALDAVESEPERERIRQAAIESGIPADELPCK